MYGYGDKQIPGHMWLITEENFYTYMAVSGDGNCIPLTQTLYLRSPIPVIISMTITDFTPGIKDRSVFVIPDICNKT
ncbi:unnamed protein product [Rotaria sp. Silwood1]|nr:unnamed protein product [Rotaria sp. Silwood1]CAF1633936.1 unnamed protein product [Rotaria sp. Silwood1]CAF4888496.1 unnamed protein product [Rotaria sp. Silwood1]